MSEFNEDGTVVRKFPVKMVKGDSVVFADTETAVVQREWDGFQTEDAVKARAAAEKATKQAEADKAKAEKAAQSGS